MPDRTELGISSLEQRLKHLEEQARFTLDVLEMAATLGDFQTCINKMQDPTALLEETAMRIDELVHFSASSFYLVNEDNSDFTLSLCSPPDFKHRIEKEIINLIENGIFSLAVRENRPITVYSSDNKYRMVLHVLSTSSRTRGMFVGIMPKEERNLSGILMSLLSIILKNCANAIESFELYRLFKSSSSQRIDQYPFPACTLDAAGSILEANTAFCSAIDISPVDAKGNLLQNVLTKDSKAVAAAIAECATNKREQCLSISLAQGKNTTTGIHHILSLYPSVHSKDDAMVAIVTNTPS